MAKAKNTTDKKPVVIDIDEQAWDELVKIVSDLDHLYGNVEKLENRVQAELVIFYYKAKVEPRSREARALNARARKLLTDTCPNMKPGTVQLFIKNAQSITSYKKLKLNSKSTPESILDKFEKAEDNTNTKGKKLTFSGYLRKSLKPSEPKGDPDDAIKIAEFKVDMSTARTIIVEVMDPIRDILTQNDTKLDNSKEAEFVSGLLDLVNEHIVHIDAA